VSAGTVAAHAKRRRVSGRAVALIVVVAALLVAAMYPLRAYLHERSDIASLEHQVSVLQKTNSQLDSRISQLHDAAYLDRMARECLGMVKPGEIPFVVVPKHGRAGPRLC
jgi:cell division protein FtsB